MIPLLVLKHSEVFSELTFSYSGTSIEHSIIIVTLSVFCFESENDLIEDGIFMHKYTVLN